MSLGAIIMQDDIDVFTDPTAEKYFARIKWEWCDCGCNCFTPTDADSVEAWKTYVYYCMDHGIEQKRPKVQTWKGF